MKIQIEINQWDFNQWFRGSQYENNFSDAQLEILYDAIEGMEDEDGLSPFGNDITAIACTFSGYDRDELVSEYADQIDYDIDDDNIEFDQDDAIDSVIEYLEQNTSVYYDSEKKDFIITDF